MTTRKAKAHTGSFVLRLAALAHDDGGESESTGGTPLSNPGQRMGAIARTMGLVPLAASFGRGAGGGERRS